MKSSFAVVYRLCAGDDVNVVLGVTSIVPNLNGLLFFTEDREDHQVEYYQMRDGYFELDIDYNQDDYLNSGDNEYHIHDHRNK